MQQLQNVPIRRGKYQNEPIIMTRKLSAENVRKTVFKLKIYVHPVPPYAQSSGSSSQYFSFSAVIASISS